MDYKQMLSAATCCWLISNICKPMMIVCGHSETTIAMNPGRMLLVSEATGFAGIIVSPNYPEAFPKDLEYSEGCQNEYVRILTRNSASLDVHEKKFCGNTIPAPYRIMPKKRDATIVVFNVSNSNNTRRGFKIQYQYLSGYGCRNGRWVDVKHKCDHIDDCGDASDEDLSANCTNLPTLPYESNFECGLTHIEPQNVRSPDIKEVLSRLEDGLVGGDYALPGSWPSQVNLEINSTLASGRMCGATLIHPMFAITAAHCVADIPTKNLKLLFGQHDILAIPMDGDETQTRYADETHIYLDDYDLHNDIALIRFNAPVQLSRKIWPACLPHLNELIAAGRLCYTTGWGKTHTTESNSDSILKQAAQLILQQQDCLPDYPRNHPLYPEDYSEICVANFDGDTCYGDGGGPLYCKDIVNNGTGDEHEKTQTMHSGNHTTRWTVHGVTSRSVGASTIIHYAKKVAEPKIFARISTKVQWILSHMNLDIDYLSGEDQKNAPNFKYLFRHKSKHFPRNRSYMTKRRS